MPSFFSSRKEQQIEHVTQIGRAAQAAFENGQRAFDGPNITDAARQYDDMLSEFNIRYNDLLVSIQREHPWKRFLRFAELFGDVRSAKEKFDEIVGVMKTESDARRQAAIDRVFTGAARIIAEFPDADSIVHDPGAPAGLTQVYNHARRVSADATRSQIGSRWHSNQHGMDPAMQWQGSAPEASTAAQNPYPVELGPQPLRMNPHRNPPVAPGDAQRTAHAQYRHPSHRRDESYHTFGSATSSYDHSVDETLTSSIEQVYSASLDPRYANTTQGGYGY
ncbi:hypothetical protein H0H93_007206 [Arthromyces matolae]|nr:hypothetical protein H0H93_007206 [Arthromyces matolae]